MVWDLILGFVFLVVGTYIGASLALHSYFGRSPYEAGSGNPGDGDEIQDTGGDVRGHGDHMQDHDDEDPDGGRTR